MTYVLFRCPVCGAVEPGPLPSPGSETVYYERPCASCDGRPVDGWVAMQVAKFQAADGTEP